MAGCSCRVLRAHPAQQFFFFGLQFAGKRFDDALVLHGGPGATHPGRGETVSGQREGQRRAGEREQLQLRSVAPGQPGREDDPAKEWRNRNKRIAGAEEKVMETWMPADLMDMAKRNVKT